MLRLLMFFSFFVFGASSSMATTQDLKTDIQISESSHIDKNDAHKHKKFSRKQFEKQLGRKLKFKERLGFMLMKGRINKELEKNSNKEGEKLPTDGLAITSFIFGIVGVFFAGLIFGLLAIIFGVLSLEKIKRSNGRVKGKGLAIAGTIIGLISLIGAIFLITGTIT